MCNHIQLWGFGVFYRTSDVAPIVAAIVAVLVLVLVAAIAVLGFIAAFLLAALVLGFIAVTATAAAAVAASALVTAAAPAALDTASGLEVQVDAAGAGGVVVEGVAREPQPLLRAVVLVPHKEPKNQPIFTLRIWSVAVGFLCAAVPSAAATTTTATHWLYSFEVLPSSSGSSIRTSTSRWLPTSTAGGSSGWRGAQALCLATSVASAAAAFSAWS